MSGLIFVFLAMSPLMFGLFFYKIFLKKNTKNFNLTIFSIFIIFLLFFICFAVYSKIINSIFLITPIFGLILLKSFHIIFYKLFGEELLFTGVFFQFKNQKMNNIWIHRIYNIIMINTSLFLPNYLFFYLPFVELKIIKSNSIIHDINLFLNFIKTIFL